MMKISALLIACAAAAQLNKIEMPKTVDLDLELPEFEAESVLEENPSECHGGGDHYDYDCIKVCDLGAGVTGETSGGSYAYQAARNESIPDKLYKVEART